MIIDKVYTGVLAFANKTQSGGYISPDRFNTYAEYAQMDIINELHELLSFNQRVITLVSDVVKVTNINVNATQYADLPSDYYKYMDSDGLFYDGGWKGEPADYISKTEIGERRRSKIVDPTNDYPVITEDSVGLFVDPKTVTRLKLTYIFEPETPEWVGFGVPPVFDESYSTDFTLSSKFQNILIQKICKYFAIEIKDSSLFQATTESLIREVGVRK